MVPFAGLVNCVNSLSKALALASKTGSNTSEVNTANQPKLYKPTSQHRPACQSLGGFQKKCPCHAKTVLLTSRTKLSSETRRPLMAPGCTGCRVIGGQVPVPISSQGIRLGQEASKFSRAQNVNLYNRTAKNNLYRCLAIASLIGALQSACRAKGPIQTIQVFIATGTSKDVEPV